MKCLCQRPRFQLLPVYTCFIVSTQLGNLTALGISTSHSRPMGTTPKRTTTTFRSLSTLLKPHNNITRLALVYGESWGSGQVGKLPGLTISKWSGWSVLGEGRTLTLRLLSNHNVSSHTVLSPEQPETTLENCFAWREGLRVVWMIFLFHNSEGEWWEPLLCRASPTPWC